MFHHHHGHFGHGRGMYRPMMRRWIWGRPRGWGRWHRPYRRGGWGCGCLPFFLILALMVAAMMFFGFVSWFIW